VDTQWERRLAAVSGVLGVVVLLVAQGLVLNGPSIEKPPAEIRAWAADHRTLFLTAVYLFAAGITLQLVFWVGVWQRLRRVGQTNSLLPTAGLAGVFLLSALLVSAFTFTAELAFRAAQLTDDTARALNDLTLVAVNLSDAATALALGAFGVAIVRDKAFVSWLGWFGLVAAAVHLVAGGAFAHEGFLSPQGIGIYVAPVLFYAWVVAASVLIWRSAGSSPSAEIPVVKPA
jgi:Domain of unknown function (DUF4386)